MPLLVSSLLRRNGAAHGHESLARRAEAAGGHVGRKTRTQPFRGQSAAHPSRFRMALPLSPFADLKPWLREVLLESL